VLRITARRGLISGFSPRRRLVNFAPGITGGFFVLVMIEIILLILVLLLLIGIGIFVRREVFK
jgi:hypothetical protein